MLRRMLPVLIVVGVGLLAFTAGLVALERTFGAERDAASVALHRQREALAQYAASALRDMLHRGLENARGDIDRAREEPLVSDDGLLLIEDGEQVLPRLVNYASGDHPNGSPDTEREEIRRRLELAVEHGQRSGIEAGFRALLAHRARNHIAVEQDVTEMIGLLDWFTTKANVDDRLMAGLLHDGFSDPRVGTIEGLQSSLLRGRNRFSKTEFDRLAGRVHALSARFGVPHDDFDARLADAPGAAIDLKGATLPALVGDWYVEQDGRNAVRGVHVELPRFISKVQSEMAIRGLIDADDRLRLPALQGGVLPMAALVPEVESPAWTIEEKRILRHFQFKTGLIAVTGLLALGLVGLLVLDWSRRQSYLQLKSDFLATVSHELRTPLASLRVMTETLEQRVEGIAGMRDYPARMLGDIDQLGFLVENILSFNRLDKGRWTPRIGQVALVDVLGAVRTELSGHTKKPVQLQVEGLDGMTVEGDADMLRLLFANLARNACQYNAREQVELRITAEQTDRLRVRVQDNGVGVPVAEREKIFDEFYRGSLAKSARGSGLGLALCRRIMRLHGGTIHVASSGPEGTTFELTFA